MRKLGFVTKIGLSGSHTALIAVASRESDGTFVESTWLLKDWTQDALSFVRIGDQVSAEGEPEKLPSGRDAFKAERFERWRPASEYR
jgi:hypothetical protein